MRVSLIGGLDRLTHHYRDAARRLGIELQVFNRAEANLATRIGGSAAVVIFTGNISHQARNTALGAARARTIPVFQYHTCGVCTLRRCLADLSLEARPVRDPVGPEQAKYAPTRRGRKAVAQHPTESTPIQMRRPIENFNAQEARGEPGWVELVCQHVGSLRHGVVQIVVHDAHVTQIGKAERVRLEKPAPDTH